MIIVLTYNSDSLRLSSEPHIHTSHHFLGNFHLVWNLCNWIAFIAQQSLLVSHILIYDQSIILPNSAKSWMYFHYCPFATMHILFLKLFWLIWVPLIQLPHYFIVLENVYFISIFYWSRLFLSFLFCHLVIYTAILSLYVLSTLYSPTPKSYASTLLLYLQSSQTTACL